MARAAVRVWHVRHPRGGGGAAVENARMCAGSIQRRIWAGRRPAPRVAPDPANASRAPARQATSWRSRHAQALPPYKFSGRPIQTTRQTLPAGDYAVLDGDRALAAVERKSLEDLVKSLVDDTLGFQLAEPAALPTAAVVVEERYGALTSAPRVSAGSPCELLACLQVRYPCVPIVFADSRKLAEHYTHRFLATAAAHHRDPE
jgi:hypothetical protein